jgi:hypothetical protein
VTIACYTEEEILPLSKLPQVYFHAAGQNRQQLSEFETFIGYLLKGTRLLSVILMN